MRGEAISLAVLAGLLLLVVSVGPSTAAGAGVGSSGTAVDERLVLDRSFRHEHTYGTHPGHELDALGLRYYWHEVDLPANAARVVVSAHIVDRPADTADLQLEVFEAARENATDERHAGVNRAAEHARVEWTTPESRTVSWSVSTDSGVSVERTFETRIRAFEPAADGGDTSPREERRPRAQERRPDAGPPDSDGELARRGVGSLVGLVAFAAVRGVGRVLGVRAYHRIEDDEVLDHPVRSRVHEASQARPGTAIQRIADALDVSRSTVEHHVDKLEDADLVVVERISGCRRVYPIGLLTRDQRRACGLLRSPETRRALRSIREEPAGVRELARRLDLAPSTASHHVEKLREAGLVTNRAVEGCVQLEATPLGRRALDRWGST